MGLLHYTLHVRTHTHTHTQDYTNLKNMQNHNNDWIDLYQTTLYIDCLTTVIINIHTQQYTCVDVLPEDNLA